MTRLVLAATGMLLLSLFLTRCDSDSTPVITEGLTYLGREDSGCFDRGLVEPGPGSTVLRDARQVGDTLLVTIRLVANCCPSFEEHVEWAEETLRIGLLDTLNGCRCLCAYDHAFRFQGTPAGAFRLVFRNCVFTVQECPVALDTLVTSIGV